MTQRAASRRRPDRGLLGWFAAAVATVLLTVLIPMTTSAFTATLTNSQNRAGAKQRFTCSDVYAADRRRSQAYFEFAFDDEAGSTTAHDSSDADNPGTYQGSNAKDTAAPSACPYDPGGAYRLDGSTSHVITAKEYPPILTSFSVEAWFETTSPGKIVGFQSTSDYGSGQYDKHLYVGRSGVLVYGIYHGGTEMLFSPSTVTDGLWHHAVGTTGPGGSKLYVDGALVASETSYTTAEYYSGYWRVGQGNLGTWSDTPDDVNNAWFTGSIRFAAAYPYVLTADEVASEWSIGRPRAITGGPGSVVDPPATSTVEATPEPTTASATPTATATNAPAASVDTVEGEPGVSIAQ